MPLKLITPPQEEPVTLTEVKAHLRIDSDEEDVWLNSAIKAARELCEALQGRKYITQTWEKYLTEWPSKDYIELVPGLQTVDFVKYYDFDGAEYTFEQSKYEVDNLSLIGKIVLKQNENWPTITLRSVNGICIRFKCGYGSAADVPETIKNAMKMLIAHWYENRETVLVGSMSKEIEFAVHALLASERVVVA